MATIHDIIGKKKEGSAIPKVVINQDNRKVTNLANICNEFNKFVRLLHQKWRIGFLYQTLGSTII